MWNKEWEVDDGKGKGTNSCSFLQSSKIDTIILQFSFI